MEKAKEFFNSHWQKIAVASIGVAAFFALGKRSTNEPATSRRPARKKDNG